MAKNKEIKNEELIIDKVENNEIENNEVEEKKVVTPNYSEAELDKMALESVKEMKKDMVSIKIPKDQLNPNNDVVPVVIDGYFWYIKRGEKVEVPKVVEEVLEQAGYL